MKPLRYTWAHDPYDDEYLVIDTHTHTVVALAKTMEWAQELAIHKNTAEINRLHHMVPKMRRPGKLVRVYAITQGLGYNIRAWSVFTKEETGWMLARPPVRIRK